MSINKLTTSAAGLALIKKYEGLGLSAYLCPAGKPTIGYGHLIKKSEKYFLRPITEAQAEALLLADCKIAEIFINGVVRVPLTQGQFDALVSFCFNLGVGALDKSSLLSYLNAGNYGAASMQFQAWVKVRNPKTNQLEISRGLINRRMDEYKLFVGSV